MKHKDILGNGVLIKPNGQRHVVNLSRTDINYNGRTVFKYGMLNATQIHLVPMFWPGEGNPIVDTKNEFVVVVKSVYEKDGYWQLIAQTKLEDLPEPVTPLKEVKQDEDKVLPTKGESKTTEADKKVKEKDLVEKKEPIQSRKVNSEDEEISEKSEEEKKVQKPKSDGKNLTDNRRSKRNYKRKK